MGRFGFLRLRFGRSDQLFCPRCGRRYDAAPQAAPISKVQFSEKAMHLISKLSEHSFGVYLVHAFLLDIIGTTGLKPTMLHPLVMMPVITLLTFSVSFVSVMLIRRIPRVGRKIT